VSYVDGVDDRWRIDVIEAATPDSFDPAARRLALDADMARAIAVKDPWVRRVGERWWMFVSYGERGDVDERKLHGSGDALSTGAVKSETGLATSVDGVRWNWEGRVLAAANKGWDKATARLTTAFRGGDGWVGIYDGAADIGENYEERCGMARSRGSADLGADRFSASDRRIGWTGDRSLHRERRLRREVALLFRTHTRGWRTRALHELRAGQRIGPRQSWLIQKTRPSTRTIPTKTA